MNKLFIEDFNLKHTIESGQFFSFSKINGGYSVVTQDHAFFVKQDGMKLLFDCSRKFIKNFLGINENYSKIKKKIAKDENIKKLVDKYHGLRIMKQDPWQCIVSFICSSASNVPKIMKNVGLLSQMLGEKNHRAYLFPSPGSLKDLNKIKKCAVGFRAKYLFGANKIVDGDWIDELKKMDYSRAKQELMNLPGVGEKIADCVCLFSLGHYQAFPVDVWIKRIMENTYFGKKTSAKEILTFAHNYFGEYAGYAQQYLYHGGRIG